MPKLIINDDECIGCGIASARARLTFWKSFLGQLKSKIRMLAQDVVRARTIARWTPLPM